MSLTYSELLTQLAEHVGADPSSLLAQQVLRVGTLDIFLQPGETQESLLLCSLLGMPPAARLAEALRTLMQANHRWMGTGGGILGLAPAGTAISWSLRLPARDLDGARLGAAIADYAALGQAWMQYLAASPDAPVRAAAPAPDTELWA